MKRIFWSVFVVLLCICVICLCLTGKPITFSTLVYFVNNAPSASISISSWVSSVTVPYITDSWNFTIINLNPVRDFFNGCVSAVNVVWRPLSFVFAGLKYVVEWWTFVISYFLS